MGLRDENDTLRGELDAAQREIDSLKRRYANRGTQIKNLRVVLDQVQRELFSRTQEVAALRVATHKVVGR